MTRIEPDTHAHPKVIIPELPSEKPTKNIELTLTKIKTSPSIPPLESLDNPTSYNPYQKKYRPLAPLPKISHQNKKV